MLGHVSRGGGEDEHARVGQPGGGLSLIRRYADAVFNQPTGRDARAAVASRLVRAEFTVLTLGQLTPGSVTLAFCTPALNSKV